MSASDRIDGALVIVTPSAIAAALGSLATVSPVANARSRTTWDELATVSSVTNVRLRTT